MSLTRGRRKIDIVGAVLSVVGMGGVVLGILVWQEGGQFVGLLIGIGAATLVALTYWLAHRKRLGKPTLLDPDLFKHLNFRIGISQQMLQQITLGGAMIALPLFLQMTLEYNTMQAGLSLAPLSLSMFGMAMLASRKAGKWRAAQIVMAGFALSTIGMAAIIPLVPRVDSGWYLVIPLVIAGSGLGMLVSQLNNFTLAPIAEDRVSEAAGVNSAAGSFGLSFGLAMAGGIMLWALALSFTHMTEASVVIPPAQQQQISTELEHDAEVMSNTQLQMQITGEPKTVQDELLAINTRARNLSLQVALLIPAIASLLGLANSFRMLCGSPWSLRSESGSSHGDHPIRGVFESCVRTDRPVCSFGLSNFQSQTGSDLHRPRQAEDSVGVRAPPSPSADRRTRHHCQSRTATWFAEWCAGHRSHMRVTGQQHSHTRLSAGVDQESATDEP